MGADLGHRQREHIAPRHTTPQVYFWDMGQDSHLTKRRVRHVQGRRVATVGPLLIMHQCDLITGAEDDPRLFVARVVAHLGAQLWRVCGCVYGYGCVCV